MTEAEETLSLLRAEVQRLEEELSKARTALFKHLSERHRDEYVRLEREGQ